MEVVTTTSEKYADSFGFTQQEVSEALREYGLQAAEAEVKEWYDGFSFGKKTDIYNPWSIINYLDKRIFSAYWANTSSNSLVGKLIREGSKDVRGKGDTAGREDTGGGGCVIEANRREKGNRLFMIN